MAKIIAGGAAMAVAVSLCAAFLFDWLTREDLPERSQPTPRTLAAVVEDWQTVDHWEHRHPFANELIRDDHLRGRTKAEVKEMLGADTYGPYGYGDLKYRIAPNGIDDLWLCIYLDEADAVREVMIQSD
ncbi:MAG: hypothetical protein AAGK78_11725 [Planctomycetota bacterium]